MNILQYWTKNLIFFNSKNAKDSIQIKYSKNVKENVCYEM